MSVGANAAVVAAVAIAEMQRKEEEEMTPYSSQDLAEGWEFKILRAYGPSFSDPQRLQAVLDEEKQGGWVLVEIFDAQRIRLKRPSGTKVVQGEFADSYNPYRTTLPPSPGMMKAAKITIGGLFVLAILILIVFLSS